MQLDSFTQEVLSNFAQINNSIVIHEGNEIRTMPENRTILAEATVPNTFNRTFGIYDLRKFLGCLSLTKDPTLSTEEDYVEIQYGKNNIKYWYTDPSSIVSPTKRINLGNIDVQFVLTQETLAQVVKASQVLSLDDLCVTKVNDEVVIQVLDKKNPTTNTATFPVEGSAEGDFKAYLKVSNLKLIQGDYDVKISSKGISLFSSKSNDLKYYIAVEADSNFGVNNA